MKKDNKEITRREFFRTFGRTAIGGALAALAVVMWKRKSSLPNQECINKGVCGPCSAFDKCELPQALSVKKVKNG